jgi:Ca-activated chloride channel family protein
MNNEDEVGLVVYGSNARVLLPSTLLRHRRQIEQAIAALRPEGATNAEAGLREGYRLAERSFRKGWINRVVLCSDGVANVGQTGADDILHVIKEQAGDGIALTTVGFGMGNYNDVLMEKLADQGDGNYYYVDDITEARRVFVENLTGTLQTIAEQTKIQVEFETGAVRRYRLLGYENRDVADRDFRNDAIDAGEVGAGHEVTALFEVKLERGARRGDLATVRIRYEDPETGRVTEESRTLRVQDVKRSLDDADPSFRMDAAVAEFSEILRHSYWAKDGSLAEVAGMAREASRQLGSPEQLAEMCNLV